MSAARFEIVRTDAEQPWHARFRAANGRIVWTTEKYARRNAAVLAVHQFGKPIKANRLWEHAVLTQRHGAIEVRDVDIREGR